MKINFLNDESYKFDEQLESNQNPIQMTQFDEDVINEQDVFNNQNEMIDSSIDEFPSVENPQKKSLTEHDTIIDESNTHRKFRLIALSAVIVLVAIYLSLDYIDIDKWFPESEDEQPKEYIETIVRDTSASKPTSKKAVKKEPQKKNTKQTKTVKQQQTTSIVNADILRKSSLRANQLNTVEHISSFSFVSAKLQHIYLNNQTVFFEVFSETRKKLASFSKALNNQIRQIKLTESRNYNNNGYSAIYRYPSSNQNNTDYNLLQKSNEIIALIKQLAQNNSIKLLETTIERSNNSDTPVLIRAMGSLKQMNQFIQIINQSLNNVELSKFSLASTKQKENTQAEFLLSMRLIVLN